MRAKRQAGDCERAEENGPRVRELDAAYYHEVFVTSPAIKRCRGQVPAAPSGAQVRRGGFVDMAIGLAIGYDEYGNDQTLLGGPSIAVGGFVAPKVSLALRMSGGAFIEEGFVYLGILGPALQYWPTDQLFLGRGVGKGLVFGCIDRCDAALPGFGASVRAGLAFGRGAAANASFELTTLADEYESVTIGALLLGFQSR